MVCLQRETSSFLFLFRYSYKGMLSPTEGLTIILLFLLQFTYSFYYHLFYTFCKKDLSEMARLISFNFLRLMHWYLKFVPTFNFLKIRFLSKNYCLKRFFNVMLSATILEKRLFIKFLNCLLLVKGRN